MPRKEAEKYTEEQCAARMLSLDEAREFIQANEWTFAKTMPHLPHWYMVRRNVNNDKFVGFVKLIRTEGDSRRWGCYRHTYLDIDGYQYWTMGAPINVTIIINRSKLGDPRTNCGPHPPVKAILKEAT